MDQVFPFKPRPFKVPINPLMDGFQTGLDIVGLAPGLGEIADGINGGISLLRGDYVDAGLSFASMIPFAGWAASIGKLGKKALKYGDEVVAAAKHVDEVGELLGRGGGKTVKFSDMTADEAMKIAKEYRVKAPIDIPNDAIIKPASKNGYEQITYKWSYGEFKYEARWHTRTPGAPIDQMNTWIVSREIPGSGSRKPQSFYKIDNNGKSTDWVTGKVWFEAIASRRAGTATTEQIKILDRGHWKE